MSGLDDISRAREQEYFRQKDKEALERIQERKAANHIRKSPICGTEMEQLTIMGVVVDRCPTSQGIWLDAGELEQIMAAVRDEAKGEGVEGFLSQFIATITGNSPDN